MFECNNSTKNITAQAIFTPPFKDLSVKYDSNVMDPKVSKVIETAKGSKFNIPENAFVFEDGSLVKDSVKIKICEYRSASEILMSGIPMTCDSAGKTYNFESAGMFEIKGNCNGKEVFLASGKSINVSFVSSDNGNYDFYCLDEQTGKWKNKGTSKICKIRPVDSSKVAVKDKKGNKEIIKKLVEPKQVNKNKSILDFDVDMQGFPELNLYSGIVWQYSDNEKYPDPDKNKWIFNTKWNKFDLKPLSDNTEYIITLSNNSKSFSTSVVPVLSKKNYNKALAIFKKNIEKYNEQITQVENEISRQEVEESFTRSFSINQMGMYNWDRFYHDCNAIKLIADFKFDKMKTCDFNKITIFLVTENGRTVVRLPKSDWNMFSFNPALDNKFIAVLPENKIAYFGLKEFKELKIDELKRSGNYCFNLKVSDTPITSSKTLNDFIANI